MLWRDCCISTRSLASSNGNRINSGIGFHTLSTFTDCIFSGTNSGLYDLNRLRIRFKTYFIYIYIISCFIKHRYSVNYTYESNAIICFGGLEYLFLRLNNLKTSLRETSSGLVNT